MRFITTVNGTETYATDSCCTLLLVIIFHRSANTCHKSGLLVCENHTHTAHTSTRGRQKVLGNPLLTENERKVRACSDVVVSLTCLLAAATVLVRSRRAVLLLCRFS
jgi:hypothetical protein